jgi:hypothetical protein
MPYIAICADNRAYGVCLGYRIGGGLSCNRRYTGGLLLGYGYSVPVERLSDCTHVQNGGAGIVCYKFIVILLQNGIIQVLVFNEYVPCLHRFYSVLAFSTFSMMFLQFCKCEIIKKALFYAGLSFTQEYKAWLFYRISKTNVPIMHRKNNNSQNACFLFCKMGTLQICGIFRRRVLCNRHYQAACCWGMGDF